MGFRAVMGLNSLLDNDVVTPLYSARVSLRLHEVDGEAVLKLDRSTSARLKPEELREFSRLCYTMADRIDRSMRVDLSPSAAGGIARAAVLTPEKRSEIASKGGKARIARLRQIEAELLHREKEIQAKEIAGS